MHFTSRKPSVDFVQGAFLELLINSDLSFRLKLVTVRAENSCELFTVWEGCFRSDANRFWRELFFSAVPHSDRTEDLRRRVSEQWDSRYLPVDRPD